MELSESYQNRIKELAGIIQENLYIYRDDVQNQLNSIKRGTPIYFKKHGDDKVRKVYYSGFRNNSYWGNAVGGGPSYNSYQKDERLFPSKDVEIVRIGNDTVESKEDFDDRIETLKMIDREKWGQAKRQDYINAYQRNKQSPNID